MSAYYNEIDPLKAEVLREAIKANAIAPGDVDERSIKDVQPGDLVGYTQCHFFAGGGFWSLALRWAGWPDDRPVWTGSCPCPSFSAAGKGGGFDDPRHLWPHWDRLIDKSRPAVIFGEQADDAIGFGWLDLVQTDLEAKAYSIGAVVFGAHSVGAGHIRQRLYFGADTDSAIGECATREGPRSGEAPGGRPLGKSAGHCNALQPSHAERIRRRGRGIDHGCGAQGGGDDATERSAVRKPATARGANVKRPDAERAEVRTRPSKVRSGAGQDAANGSRERSSAGERADSAATGSLSSAQRRVHGSEESGGPRTSELERSCDARDRSNADGGVASNGHIQRSGQHGLFTQDRGAGDHSDATERRLAVRRSTSRSGGHASFASEPGIGLDAIGERLEGRAGNVRDWRGPGWLDPEQARSIAETGATRGFWADCDWWYGRDGKYRPIGPGIFPLAHGSPARVGRLRMYGDGIVVTAAQAFIESYCEARGLIL